MLISLCFPGTKIFESGFTVKGNMNTNTTNGVDLSTRLFTLHTDQVITAPYSFTNVVAEKNVYLQGYFNNIDLKRLASGALTSDDKFATGMMAVPNRLLFIMIYSFPPIYLLHIHFLLSMFCSYVVCSGFR